MTIRTLSIALITVCVLSTPFSVSAAERRPTCKVSASDKSIVAGEPTTITWASKYSEYGMATPGSRVAVQGSWTGYPQKTTTYRFEFFNTEGRSKVCNVKVTVAKASGSSTSASGVTGTTSSSPGSTGSTSTGGSSSSSTGGYSGGFSGGSTGSTPGYIGGYNAAAATALQLQIEQAKRQLEEMLAKTKTIVH